MKTMVSNPVKEASTILEILTDESPLVNWDVEYDSFREGFYIKGNILVKDMPINGMYFLLAEEYRQRVWLTRIKYEIANLIASQLLKKP